MECGKGNVYRREVSDYKSVNIVSDVNMYMKTR